MDQLPALALPVAAAPARSTPAGEGPDRRGSPARHLGTAVLVAGPLVAVAVAIPLLWGRALSPLDLALAAAFYVVTGHGITVGYHRMFTHRAFRPNRGLKIALGVVGSMAVQRIAAVRARA